MVFIIIFEIKKLPGVGDYTANALLGLVYNQPRIAVDGNVKRVFARYLNKKETKINFEKLIDVNKKNLFSTFTKKHLFFCLLIKHPERRYFFILK